MMLGNLLLMDCWKGVVAMESPMRDDVENDAFSQLCPRRFFFALLSPSK
jgi:hypothetical protein